MAHFAERFCYFCSAECEEKYRSEEPARSQARPKRGSEPAPAEPPLPSFENPNWQREIVVTAADETSEGETAGTEPETAAALLEDPAVSVDAGTLLLSLAVLGATLSLVLLHQVPDNVLQVLQHLNLGEELPRYVGECHCPVWYPFQPDAARTHAGPRNR